MTFSFVSGGACDPGDVWARGRLRRVDRFVLVAGRLWTSSGPVFGDALTSLGVVGGGQVDAFRVVPEQIRQASGRVAAEAEAVRRVGGLASGGAAASAAGAGEVS